MAFLSFFYSLGSCFAWEELLYARYYPRCSTESNLGSSFMDGITGERYG
jgi:hypothetical protein